MEIVEETAWTESDTTLLDDLLSFLDAAPTATVCDGVATQPTFDDAAIVHVPHAPVGKAHQWTAKHKITQLRAEVHQLTAELHRLQKSTGHTRSATMETARNERFKRRRAETDRQQLRDAVYKQTQFIRGLRSVFSTPPSFTMGLNLCQYLHNYTRLPRDSAMRSKEYAALAQETRLRVAMDILTRETRLLFNDGGDVLSPCVGSPYIRTEQLTDRHGFGMTTTSVFALDTSDVGVVLRGACVAVSDIVAKCQTYACTSQRQEIVEPGLSSVVGSNALSTILYRVMGVHHKSLRDNDELVSESRIVTLYKQTDDYAVVLWDYVDDDELHPETESTDITRQAVGACLIRRELCGDGVERTVYRAISTRRYRFHDHDANDPEQLMSFSRREALQRFQYRYLAADKMKTNELAFRRIILECIENEEAVRNH